MCRREKAAALLKNVVAHNYDPEFNTIASTAAPFEMYLNSGGGGDDDTTDFQDAFAEYKESLMEVPVSTEAAASGATAAFAAIPGDEKSEDKEKLYAKVTQKRRESVKFYFVREWKDDIYKKGGKLSEIYQRSNFASARGEPGKKNSLLLFLPELHPTAGAFGSATSHKDPVPHVDEIGKAVKWMIGARGSNTIVLTTDGRSRKIRKAIEEILDESNPDEQKHIEGYSIVNPPRYTETFVFQNGRFWDP